MEGRDPLPAKLSTRRKFKTISDAKVMQLKTRWLKKKKELSIRCNGG